MKTFVILADILLPVYQFIQIDDSCYYATVCLCISKSMLEKNITPWAWG